MWLKNYFIYLCLTFFFAGIFSAKLINVKSHNLFLVLGLFFLFLLLFIEISKSENFFHITPGPESKILFGILLVFLIFGHVRMREKQYVSMFENFYEQDFTIKGRVLEELSHRSSNVRYKIKVKKISGKSKTLYGRNKEKIIISTGSDPKYKIGDILNIRGRVQKPENFLTDTGTEFDYINFLAKDDIHGLMHFASVEIVESDKRNMFQALSEFKNYLTSKIESVLPTPHSGLMKALLLGDRQSLDSEIQRKFRMTGLAHVIVFSGFHVTLMILIMFRVMIMLPLFLKYCFGITAIIFLAMMVGLSATVVRATVTAVLVIVGKMSGRNYKINRSLCLTALIMTIHNPLILFYDLSFRLSFAATIGVVNLSKQIEPWLTFMTSRLSIRKIASVTSAAQISVTPIIIGMSNELPTLAIPVNLIILPLIPITMVSGLLTLISVIIFEPLGLLVSLVSFFLISLQLNIVDLFSRAPLSVVGVDPMSSVQAILFYCFVVFFFNHTPIQIRKKIVDIFPLSARLVIGHKRMLPHINRQDWNRRI